MLCSKFSRKFYLRLAHVIHIKLLKFYNWSRALHIIDLLKRFISCLLKGQPNLFSSAVGIVVKTLLF